MSTNVRKYNMFSNIPDEIQCRIFPYLSRITLFKLREYVPARVWKYTKYETLRDAIENNCLLSVKYLYLREEHTLSVSVFTAAASSNNIEIMRFLFENGCPFNKWTMAATNGNLEIIKWLRERGCEWCHKTFTNAAFNGNIPTLEYLLENKCPWNSWTFPYAVSAGNLNVIKWLYRAGFPINTVVFS